MAGIPPLTRVILIATVTAFVVQGAVGSQVWARFALWALGPLFAPWQILTYGFLHAGVGHLFFNMFAVYMFGAQLERTWGPARYAVYYAACLISAALVQLVATALSGFTGPSLGASGAVFGLLLAFGVTYPRQTIVLLIPPIPMPAWLFVTLYGLAELIFGITGAMPGVAHFAHLGGMLGGGILIALWRLTAR